MILKLVRVYQIAVELIVKEFREVMLSLIVISNFRTFVNAYLSLRVKANYIYKKVGKCANSTTYSGELCPHKGD